MGLLRCAVFPLAAGGLVCLAVAGAEPGKPNDRNTDRPNPAAKGAPHKGAEKNRAAVKDAVLADAEREAHAAVNASAKSFADAFNRHDARAIAQGFTPEAEFITEDGTVLRGREAIGAHFDRLFAAMPKSRIGLRIDSIQAIAPNVLIEEGLAESAADPDAAPEHSRYVAVHVKADGRWLVARSRDFSAEPQSSAAHSHLRELDFLVGNWIGEGEDVLSHTTCKWSDDGNFLLQEFTVRIAGRVSVSATMRIGWDAQSRQIRSWTFDSQGGFSEARWTRVGNEWVLKAQGVTHLGRSSSATTILRQIDGSTLSWESRDRMEGGQAANSVSPIIIKRQPPPPVE